MPARKGRRAHRRNKIAERQESEPQPKQDPNKNHWGNLDVSGFSDTGRPKPAPPKTPLPTICEQSSPNANPWADLDISGFSSVPSLQHSSNLHSDTTTKTGTTSSSRQAEKPQFVPMMPIHIAAHRLQDRRNLESDALLSDGSVVITRDWVCRMVGKGNIEFSCTNIILARNSAIRSRGHEFGLHPAFIRWMTEENPDSSFGERTLRMDPEQAKEWFAED